MTVEANAIKTVVELPRLAQSEEPGGAAFGRIVNTMAEIDAFLDGIIVAMAKGTMEVLPLLPMV